MSVREAISLTVKDFDENEKTINIHGTLDYSSDYKNAEKEMTKTAASYRQISLSNRAIEMIQANEIKFKSSLTSNYIFVGKTGKPIQVNSLN